MNTTSKNIINGEERHHLATDDSPTMIAHLVRVPYRTTPAWQVVCDACGVMLNSGHQYEEGGKHFAEALVEEHNSTAHPLVGTNPDPDPIDFDIYTPGHVGDREFRDATFAPTEAEALEYARARFGELAIVERSDQTDAEITDELPSSPAYPLRGTLREKDGVTARARSHVHTGFECGAL